MTIVLPPRAPDYSLVIPPEGNYTTGLTLSMGGGLTLSAGPGNVWVETDADGRHLRGAGGSNTSFTLDQTEPTLGACDYVVVRAIIRTPSGTAQESEIRVVRKHAALESLIWGRAPSAFTGPSNRRSVYSYGSVGATDVQYHSNAALERRVAVMPSPTNQLQWAINATITDGELAVASNHALTLPDVVPAAFPTEIRLQPGIAGQSGLYRYDIWNIGGATTNGMWTLAQVNTATGNQGGWPLRHVNTRGNSGSWPLAHVRP